MKIHKINWSYIRKVMRFDREFLRQLKIKAMRDNTTKSEGGL